MASDGLALSPAEYSQLLAHLTRGDAVTPDYYGAGGVVGALEMRFAALLGKEAAVVMPTGTMANLLALDALAGRGTKVAVQTESHLYNDCGDCASTLAGINLIPLGTGATFDVSALEGVFERTGAGKVKTRIGALSIETPVRRLVGEMFDFAEMQAITALARNQGIGRHLDGARLFVAAAYAGRPVGDYTCLFDTVYVSLYKCFNSLSGGILAGPEAVIDQLRHWRRRNGGGMAQLWPIATIALHYLDGVTARLAAARELSEVFFSALAADDRFCITRIKNGSSITRIGLAGAGADALHSFRARLSDAGIQLPQPDTIKMDFAVTVNESWLQWDAEKLVGAFCAAAQEFQP